MNNLTRENILEVEDVMDTLHLGRNKVYELLRTGELKSIRCGRKYLIPTAALSEFISRRSTLNYFS